MQFAGVVILGMPGAPALPRHRRQCNGPVKTVAELAEQMRFAKPPTEDDVTVLPDGRRLDSREALKAWLIEVDAIRASEAATDAFNK
jgi:hypothetical protein